MRVIIDRFEEDIAVVEADGRMLNAPRALFPEAREGDAVEITVLGRPKPEAGESAHEIFVRLRAKSCRDKTAPTPSDTAEKADGDCADEDMRETQTSC